MASLVYKHMSYYAVFSIHRKKKWIKIGRVDRKEARKLLRQLEMQYIKGKLNIKEPTDVLLYDYLHEYMDYSKTNKAHSTFTRELEVKSNLVSQFGNICLKKIDNRCIEEYKSKRVSEGLKPATINRELTMLKFMLGKAQEWGYLESVPRVSFLKLTKNPVKFLSVEEMDKLIEHSSVWLRPILIVLRNTGMRIGELLNLGVDDLELEKGYIIVRSSKTNNFRMVPVNAELREMLIWLLEYCIDLKSLKITQRLPQQNKYIFCHPDGSRVKSIKHSFNKACIKAGVKATIHTIRHTFASHLVMNKVDLVSIKELLGHSNISTTMIYSHVSSEHKAKGVDMLPWLSKGR